MGISEGLIALKSIATILKEAGKIDLYQQILDAQANMLEMQSELNKLHEKYKECQEKLKTKEDITFHGSAYWKKSNNDGPFCTRCWDVNMKLIRMQVSNYYLCPECNTSYDYDGHSNNIADIVSDWDPYER